MSKSGMAQDIIYGGYTQAELDRQYDQATLVPDNAPYMDAEAERSAAAKQAFDCALDVAYGTGPREVMDVYGAGGGDKPILVFFHGGAWRRGSKDQAGGAAHLVVPAGGLHVSVEFDLAPDSTLDAILDQCRTAITHVHRHAREFGGDPSRIHLGGISSGAHLAAAACLADWSRYGCQSDVVNGLINGLTLVSGPYDLTPVKLSARNEYLFLDDAAVERNTPNRRLDRLPRDVTVAWGGRELEEFQRQGEALAGMLADGGHAVTTCFLAECNHFEMAARIHAADSPIASAILSQMGLDRPGVRRPGHLSA